jgi:hypothetical protein
LHAIPMCSNEEGGPMRGPPPPTIDAILAQWA